MINFTQWGKAHYIKGEIIMGPNDRTLTLDEETVEIIEVIENCDDYSNLDDNIDDIDYIVEY